MNTKVLKDLWKATHNKSGWLSALSVALSDAEVNYLVDLDDAHQEAMREMHKAWRSLPKPKPEVDEDFVRGRRLEYLTEQLTDARGRLVGLRMEAGRMALRGHDKSAAFLGGFEVFCAADIYQLQEQIARVETPRPKSEDDITDAMIERARRVRMEALGVPGLAGKKVACRFHGEDKHPSASIAKGFFMCFTCGKRLDAIGWLMEVDGLSFYDAVRRLLRLETA